jgi:hypothetical protein
MYIDTLAYIHTRRGTPGPEGDDGYRGKQGLVGITTGWRNEGFDCPGASTDTMRMVHCNRQGCRLETLFSSEWGTVCDVNFGEDNAKVLCKAFGYPHGGRALRHFGGGRTHPPRIWLRDVRCDAKKSPGDVGDCDHAYWGKVGQCTHDNDVGLCCFGVKSDKQGVRVGPSDFPVCPEAATDFARLRDCNFQRCRLEVRHAGKWGTVCDKGFSDNSAKVVCKSIGFSAGGVALRAGGGHGRIWLEQASCNGDENNLEWCQHRPWGWVDECDHSMDAGVCCHGDYKVPGPKVSCI